MSIEIPLNTRSDTPIFQQIVLGIEKLILIGRVGPEEFLPSVREFAVQHHVNPNTVAKAYQILQMRGLIVAVRGMGLRPSRVSTRATETRRNELLSQAVDELIGKARTLEADVEEIIEQLRARYPRSSKKEARK